MNRIEIATKLEEIAFLLTQVNENRFKILAFKKAAKSIRELSDLNQINSTPGIGPSISQVINELMTTGTCQKLKQLQKNAPPTSIIEFTQLPKIGAVGARKNK